MWGRLTLEGNETMTAKNFDKALQAYQKRRPFRPFRVRFVSGEHLDVDHPEAVVIRGGVGVYVSRTGVPTLFDHDGVSEVVGETDRQSA
jgi:hypothetical protein